MRLSDVCLTSACLTSDVCLSRTSGLRREERGLGRLKLAHGIAHVTRDSDTTFKVKVKGQGHQAALLVAALTRQVAAAVIVATYWAWETTATLLCSAELGASAPSEGGEGAGAYRGGRSPTDCY